MFEMNELYMMLSLLVVFFGYLILFRLIAALQMADIKNCSTSISKKKMPRTQVFLLLSGISQAEPSPLVLLLSKKIADLLHM